MKKVILKYELENSDKFEDALSRRDLDFSAIYWQYDRVYIPRDYKKGQNYPRLVLRTEMRAVDEAPIYQLILRRHIEDSGVDIIETTEVKDYQSAAIIAMQLGFKPAGEVSRRRQETSLDENTIIYLDELDKKSEDDTKTHYAKIETVLKTEDSVEETRINLIKTMESFGETNMINQSYFEL